mmetsp:Transcript_19466/g.39360  ORF Transcript_19466/g.39360 Transcript_19466/m.39360 type:complete len:200 (+) Transcript_19466:379-978(+)
MTLSRDGKPLSFLCFVLQPPPLFFFNLQKKKRKDKRISKKESQLLVVEHQMTIEASTRITATRGRRKEARLDHFVAMAAAAAAGPLFFACFMAKRKTNILSVCLTSSSLHMNVNALVRVVCSIFAPSPSYQPRRPPSFQTCMKIFFTDSSSPDSSLVFSSITGYVMSVATTFATKPHRKSTRWLLSPILWAVFLRRPYA